MFQDRELTCVDCNSTFIFTESEQAFYAEKGFTNDPKRCPACRAARKQAPRGGQRGTRQLYSVTCATCGAATQVPFEPKGDRPVYCRDCYKPEKSHSRW